MGKPSGASGRGRARHGSARSEQLQYYSELFKMSREFTVNYRGQIQQNGLSPLTQQRAGSRVPRAGVQAAYSPLLLRPSSDDWLVRLSCLIKV